LLAGWSLDLGLWYTVGLARARVYCGPTLLVVDRATLNPSVAASHMILAVVGAAEAIAWHGARARWVFAEGFGMAVHFMGFPFMAKKASRGWELEVSALVVLALAWLQVRINVFAT
jgi:hypothetical protein